MDALEVNGVRLGVEVRGTPDNAPLVLLHGFSGSAAGWGTHLDTLANSGLYVIALDMLGHGRSDAPVDPARYAIERCREDIIAALDQLQVHKGRAILLGYSMGGRIALYTAFSGFFRALILESASPGLTTARERAERRANDERLAERIERDGVPAFVDYWEQLPLFASQRNLPSERRERLRQQRLLNNARGLANSLRGVGTGVQPDLHNDLPRLSIPTLLLAGQLDIKYCDIAQEMARALPQARLEIIPDAGHTIHLEQPEMFDQMVEAFCRPYKASPIF